MTIKELILGKSVYAQAGNRPNYTMKISGGNGSDRNITYYNNGQFIGTQVATKSMTREAIEDQFKANSETLGFYFNGQSYPSYKDFDGSINTNTGGSGQTNTSGGVGGNSKGENSCTTPKYSEWINNKCDCRNGYAKDGSTGKEKEPKECIVNKAGSVGIKCTAQDLINNTCSRNINKTLGIRSSDTTPNPTLLLQDVVLGATSFVGTIIMVALVYLGFKAVLQGADDSDALGDIKGKAKNLIIGFLLVIGSYTIIRLVQYIARGF